MDDRCDRAARLGAALGLAAMLVGCAGGMGASQGPPGLPASPASSGAPSATSPGSASPTASTTTPTSAPATPSPTTALPGSPPAATLGGLAGGRTATGSLGSYTWAGGGSDAPWIIGKPAGSVKAGAPLRVTLGGLVPVGWTAAWAKVVDGAAGQPTGGTTGSAGLMFYAPTKAGQWSVRVTASFGPGANATYYWRVSVTQ